MTEFERLLWIGDRTNVGILLSYTTISGYCKVKPYCSGGIDWKPLQEVIVIPQCYVPPSDR